MATCSIIIAISLIVIKRRRIIWWRSNYTELEERGNGAIQRSKKQICFLRDSPEKTSGSWMAKETPSVEVRAVKGRFDLRYNNILGMLATSMKVGDDPHGGKSVLIQGLDKGPRTPR